MQMNRELLDGMTAFYRRLNNKMNELAHILFLYASEVNDIKRHWYYEMPYQDESGNWLQYPYPLPLICLKRVCNVKIHPNHIEVKTTKNYREALAYSYEKIYHPPEGEEHDYRFVVYGLDEGLDDVYSLGGSTIEGMKAIIADSDEEVIGYSFNFDFDVDCQKISELVYFLIEEGFHI